MKKEPRQFTALRQIAAGLEALGFPCSVEVALPDGTPARLVAHNGAGGMRPYWLSIDLRVARGTHYHANVCMASATSAVECTAATTIRP